MQKTDPEEWDTVISGSKMDEMNKKIEDGDITCNLDNPEDCEACGS